jgi:hypothetical protein
MFVTPRVHSLGKNFQISCTDMAWCVVNPRAKCLTLNLDLWIQGKPKHVETSKLRAPRGGGE